MAGARKSPMVSSSAVKMMTLAMTQPVENGCLPICRASSHTAIVTLGARLCTSLLDVDAGPRYVVPMRTFAVVVFAVLVAVVSGCPKAGVDKSTTATAAPSPPYWMSLKDGKLHRG